MNIIIILILSLLICSPKISLANEVLPGVQVNGCGAKGWSSFVPESSFIGNCQFHEACNKHDMCYSRCLQGGDLYGQNTCKIKQDKDKRRKECDQYLYSNIKTDNPSVAICTAYATLYRWAVMKYAEKAFSGVTSARSQMSNLQTFISYMDKNPETFDKKEVQKKFEMIEASPGTDPIVEFDQEIPEIAILAFDNDGKLVKQLSITGKKK